MKMPRFTFRSFILFVLLNSFVINAYSVAISTRRLYIDPKNNTTTIRIHNMETAMQTCDVEIRDVFINNIGNIQLVSNGDIPVNSAKPLVRLAPRRFTLGIQKHQMVKLLYRRKPGLENGEYQGVLAIACKTKQENNASVLPVTIEPTMVHNVPVIVRTGNLPIQAEFVSTEITGNTLQVTLKIQGERSITGDLTVINSASGEVIVEQKHLSIYAQQPVKKLELSLGEYKNTPLLIKYAENPKLGGNLVIQQPIN